MELRVLDVRQEARELSAQTREAGVSEVDARASERRRAEVTAGAAAADPGLVTMPNEDVITLADIVTLIRENRRLIACCVGVSLLLGLCYALFKTPEYRARVVVQPVEDEAGAASSLAGRFGGLASLAGINLGSGGNKEEYLGVLRSRHLAERFIERYQVMPELFPSLWDAEIGDWIPEPPVTTRIKRAVKGALAAISGDEGYKPRTGTKPTIGEAFEAFDRRVRVVRENPKSGLVIVTMKHRKPGLAARWANGYIAMANEEIRQRTIAEAGAVIHFLEDEADRTTDRQLKKAIFELIQSQLQRIATAKARPEYAFRIIDPAKAPEDHAGPNKFLALVLSLALGALGGIFIAFVRSRTRRNLNGVSESDALL